MHHEPERRERSHPELRSTADGVVLAVHVQPSARSDAVVGRHGDALKVKVTAPPADGRANAAVTQLVAATFGLRPSEVSLVAGESGRRKRLLLDGIDVDAAARVVDRLVGRSSW